jgi:hypothetical protein
VIDRINPIIDSVNNYLYRGHGTGIFDPERMTETRTSNCFGRQAVIGSAILDELPNTDVFLLIARNHGMPFETPSGRNIRHLAHMESVILGESTGYLLDTPPPYTLEANPSLRNLSDTTWATEASTGTVHHQNRNIALLHGRFSDDELQRLYGPPAIRALRHIFDVYPFDEGLDFYQHNASNAVGQLYTRQDYTDFYRSTILATATEEPRVATNV